MGLKDIRFTIQIVPKAPKKRPRQEGIDRVLTKRVFGVITQDTYGNATVILMLQNGWNDNKIYDSQNNLMVSLGLGDS